MKRCRTQTVMRNGPGVPLVEQTSTGSCTICVQNKTRITAEAPDRNSGATAPDPCGALSTCAHTATRTECSSSDHHD